MIVATININGSSFRTDIVDPLMWTPRRNKQGLHHKKIDAHTVADSCAKIFFKYEDTSRNSPRQRLKLSFYRDEDSL